MSQTPSIDEILHMDVARFEEYALQVFHHQAIHCPIYAQYIKAISKAAISVNNLEEIPFLPIEFFKSHRIVTGIYEAETAFTSSGTTGSNHAVHHMKSLAAYEQVFTRIFETNYGSLADYCVAALLPSYLERTGSSLVFMANHFISKTTENGSGFFLYNHAELAALLTRCEKRGQKALLLGVTFALLDFAENQPMPLKNTLVMETGGMKGRREELTRQQVHEILGEAFNLKQVHSEYGMTELMSQAYSQGEGVFQCPSWMRLLVRETTDPLSISSSGKGCLNVIDLANLHSCSFIATQDLGHVLPDGRFEVLGRMDHTEARGCNLMLQ
ncbi:MAG: acyl transferase [Flavobacteriales bacterium]